MSLLKYFNKNRERDKEWEKLMKSNSEVRVNYPNGGCFGKIDRIGNNFVFIKPYSRGEAFPLPGGGQIDRIGIEKDAALPLPKKNTLIEKIRDGYFSEFVLSKNYFSWKNAPEEFRDLAFHEYPFPPEEFIEILEGKNNNSNSEEKPYGGKKKIGF